MLRTYKNTRANYSTGSTTDPNGQGRVTLQVQQIRKAHARAHQYEELTHEPGGHREPHALDRPMGLDKSIQRQISRRGRAGIKGLRENSDCQIVRQ